MLEEWKADPEAFSKNGYSWPEVDTKKAAKKKVDSEEEQLAPKKKADSPKTKADKGKVRSEKARLREVRSHLFAVLPVPAGVLFVVGSYVPMV